MKPVETRTTNCVYTHEGCNDIPATRFESNVGNGIEVCFEISDKELEEIKKTKKVYLDILSLNIPPICLNSFSSLIDWSGKNEHFN